MQEAKEQFGRRDFVAFGWMAVTLAINLVIAVHFISLPKEGQVKRCEAAAQAVGVEK